MSARRFKSSDDYFASRSSLTKKVIQSPEKKPGKRRSGAQPGPADLKTVFFRGVTGYVIDGKTEITVGASLTDDLQSHIAGDIDISLQPVAGNGTTPWHIMAFKLSDDVDKPFSKATGMQEALAEHGIPSYIEVSGEGKGHYHLWIFHESPVDAAETGSLLRDAAKALFGWEPPVIPLGGEDMIPLPLQGEAVLLQRRVFVNSVGKKYKNQREVLEDITPCTGRHLRSLRDACRGADVRDAPSAAEPPAPEPEPMKEQKDAGVETVVQKEAEERVAPKPADAGEVGETPVSAESPARDTDVSTLPVREKSPLAAADERPVRCLAFERCGAPYAVDAALVVKVVRLSSGSAAYVARGTVVVDGNPRTYTDPAPGDEVEPPSRLVLLSPAAGGKAVAADAVTGIENGFAAGGNEDGETLVAVEGMASPIRLLGFGTPGERPVPEDAVTHEPVKSAGAGLVSVRDAGNSMALDAASIERVLPAGRMHVRDERANVVFGNRDVPVVNYPGTSGGEAAKGRLVVCSAGGEYYALLVDDVTIA